jgi:hypothetical protein
MPPIDATYTPPTELLAHQYGSDAKQLAGNPMSVIVAAGPYTVDSDLEYEPLQALLDLAKEEKPDVLILVSSAERSSAVASPSRRERTLRDMTAYSHSFRCRPARSSTPTTR